MEIIFATKNQGKVKEIKAVLGEIGINVLTMTEAGIDIDVIEDGATFEENAIKKAVEIMEVSNKIVLSDDSGLEIDFLDKKPGVHSARFMGKDTPYDIKNSEILKTLKDVPAPKRTARFVCVIAAVFPEGKVLTTRGTIEGEIAYEIKGENGFGYDPIFYVPELEKSLAEVSPSEKNIISHRGKALREMAKKLEGLLK